MPRTFDNLAHSYQRLEHFVFGDLLQRARTCHLPAIPASTRTALLLGDGDGRFAQALLARCPQIRIDSIDLSPAMLALASKRIAAPTRFHPIHADLLDHAYPTNTYDLISLNFVIDCLTQSQFETLKPQLHTALKNQGQLLYTDFQYAPGPIAKPVSKILITFLYLLFKATTGLGPTTLPSPHWQTHFKKIRSQQWLSDSLTTQLWTQLPDLRPS